MIQNSTITGNKATTGSGGGIAPTYHSCTVLIESSIISGNINAVAPDLAAYSYSSFKAKNSAIGSSMGFPFTDQGGNLPFMTDLKLGPLANNGGPTKTHLPAADSPLLDAGLNLASLPTEQRGLPFVRSSGLAPDIGAVELQHNLVVTNLNDSGAGSLRQVIATALTNPGNDFITFQAGLTGTITLTSGELAISEAITISGPGAGVISVSGNSAFRVLNTQSAPAKSQISISGLTLANGNVTGPGGGIFMSDEALTLTNCIITGNTSTWQGAGIYVYSNGSLKLQGSVFSKNSSGNEGGAIRVRTGALITIQNSSIIDNKASLHGGGLSFNSFASLLLENSTISGNTATTGNGGGISLPNYQGPNGLIIRNCTFSGNTSGSIGGGILVLGVSTVSIQNCTITGNTAMSGGGGGIGLFYHASTVNIDSCVVSGNINATAPDIVGTGESKINIRNSAIGSNVGLAYVDKGGNLPFMIDLKLGALADNGGPTKTHLPATDSPLIDVGLNIANLTSDQRGLPFVRVAGLATDIGAVEVQHQLLVTNLNDSGPGSLRQVIASALANPGADTVGFQAGLSGTIKLTTGELTIAEPLTIVGPGADLISIDGNKTSRIINGTIRRPMPQFFSAGLR